MQYICHLIHPVRRLRSEGRGRVLLAIASGWFLSIGVRTVYPALLPYMRTTYTLDLTEAGLLLTVLWISYALGQLPGGVLGDRIGEGTTMVMSTLLSAGAVLLVVTARIVYILFAATILFGLATALYGVSRFTALSDIYPEQTGTAIGVTMAAGDIGNTALPPVASFVAVTLAWQYGLGFTIPLFVLAGAGLWTVVSGRTSTSASAIDTLSTDTFRHVFRELWRPPVIRGTIILILGASALLSFTSFYPTYLVEVKGLSPPVAAGIFGFFFALGVVVKIIAGWAYDQVGLDRSLPIVMGMAVIGLTSLPWVDNFWFLVLVTIFASGLLGNGTIGFSYLTSELSSEIQGTGLGILRTFVFGLGALSPVVFGSLADRGFFNEAFLLLAGLVVLVIVVTMSHPK